MKKMLMALACGLVVTTSAFAELPDFTKVWQAIGTGRIEKAKQDIDDIHAQYRADNEGHQWTESHSDQSRRDVEEWLHFYLIKLYIAQKENNMHEVALQMTNIKQLTYLEFMGKKLVD